MTSIRVSRLSKHYSVYHKSPGFFRAFSSLFSRTYHTVKAVEDISLNINEGELVGFIGPNGAGKTTTLKCLSGLLHPTSGSVKVLGFTPHRRDNRFLKQIALVMGQKNQLYWDLPSIETFNLNRDIYEIDDDTYKKTLSNLSEMLSVTKLLKIPVRQLSLGERMKMELIAALLHQPKILFLDEPTIGLDVVMQKAMRDFIAYYNQKYHATILLTSHYMRDVKELCRRVIVIDHGKIIYDGQLSKLVSAFAGKKTITAVFAGAKIPREVFSWQKRLKVLGNRISLSVPQKQVPRIAKFLVSDKRVEDFTIEEPEIEDIIRIIFSSKNDKKLNYHEKI